MPISKLAHLSVRTTDLEASRRFYVDVIGFQEGFRPPFAFPGVWLYRGGDEADFGVVHLIGVDRNDTTGLKDYLGEKDGQGLRGSGAVDHIAFLASGLADMRRRIERAGLAVRERTVPSLGLHQVFVEDPSGGDDRAELRIARRKLYVTPLRRKIVVHGSLARPFASNRRLRADWGIGVAVELDERSAGFVSP